MLVLPLSVFADSMCVPQVSGAGVYYINAPLVDNNRGYWGVGTNCRLGNNTTVDGTERPVVCDNPIMYGESHCSASGTYPADNWEKQSNNYCWCRMTAVRTSAKDINGQFVLAPKVSAWVYLDSDDCKRWCSNRCASYVLSYPGFRRTLVASQGA